MAQVAADQAASILRQAIQEQAKARLIAATGAAQFDFLEVLTNLPRIEWSKVEIEDPYLVVKLDVACRRQQLGEGWFASLADVPQRAISMSVRQILKAKQILCFVPDARKAKAVKACFEGEISPMAPASILRTHPNTTV